MHARSPIVLITAGVLAAGGLSACGRVDASEKPNGSRPPVTLQVSAAITDRGVNLSPERIGGGPLRMVISNQTSKSVRATLAKSGGGTGRSTRYPIEPGGVAAIQATVTKGTWRVRVGRGIASARLVVGRTRGSSDDELLLP